jgi:hypothetical protein
MSDDVTRQLQELAEELRRVGAAVNHLADRQAILDCITRYNRGLDRHDESLIASAFHDDGLDNHGDFVGDGRDLATWGNALHAHSFDGHQHFLATHTVGIDGDTAHAETYWLALLRRKGGASIVIGGGRYIDRLERRHGDWKIVVRQTVAESASEANCPPFPRGDYYVHGRWDTEDISYVRPLTLDRPRHIPPVG